MEPVDLTLEVLKEIRNAVVETNTKLETLRVDVTQRIDATNARIDATNARLDGVERRQVESEVRLATEIVAVAGAVRELRDVLRVERSIRERVDDHERRLVAIERHGG